MPFYSVFAIPIIYRGIFNAKNYENLCYKSMQNTIYCGVFYAEKYFAFFTNFFAKRCCNFTNNVLKYHSTRGEGRILPISNKYDMR